MKYENPPLLIVDIGPQTSVCIRPRSSLTLVLCPLKCDLVIFPFRQDSQVGIGSDPNDSKYPFLDNL
ncbi:hypothetical protein RchiOBHm_Chr2g0086181 [Rosa chinensis]|uniref:Uncharacterized protein n=1 Tax=Rosa chinensis TaxID=74649 RepID=A0A2P6RIE1_ROSCH|nr:hypothetical protein RchiOBHm_Chr2g0086181 [Rosa chinensis]